MSMLFRFQYYVSAVELVIVSYSYNEFECIVLKEVIKKSRKEESPA